MSWYRVAIENFNLKKEEENMSEEITLDRIKNCKKKLEIDIKSLICQYTKETGTTIASINLLVVHNISIDKASYPKEVSVRVEL